MRWRDWGRRSRRGCRWMDRVVSRDLVVARSTTTTNRELNQDLLSYSRPSSSSSIITHTLSLASHLLLEHHPAHYLLLHTIHSRSTSSDVSSCDEGPHPALPTRRPRQSLLAKTSDTRSIKTTTTLHPARPIIPTDIQDEWRGRHLFPHAVSHPGLAVGCGP